MIKLYEIRPGEQWPVYLETPRDIVRLTEGEARQLKFDLEVALMEISGRDLEAEQ